VVIEMADSVKSIAELLELILPILNNDIVKGDLEKDLTRLEPQIRNEIGWTGDRGCLIYVPVGQSPLTGQLEYGGASVRGSAGSPEQALALSIGHTLKGGDPPNFSEEHTFYIWFNAPSNRWGLTTYPFTRILKSDALIIYNNKQMLSAIETKRKDDIYSHALDVLQTKVVDDTTRKLIVETSNNIRRYKEAYEHIQKDLAAKLKEAERTGEFLRNLNALKSIIGVAQLVAQAKELFPTAGIDDNDNAETVEKKIIDYKIENEKYIAHFRGEFELKRKLTNEEAEKLRPILRDNDAPDEVFNWSL
jgi:hypothetical protein